MRTSELVRTLPSRHIELDRSAVLRVGVSQQDSGLGKGAAPLGGCGREVIVAFAGLGGRKSGVVFVRRIAHR